MKFLHTSDWHIGKKLEGRDRLTEQRAVLNEIAMICERENIEVVLIAGDIFDTYLPSAEAEDLFYDTLMRLSAHKRLVVVISGNHDDATRLCAAIPLAEKLGIIMAGNLNHPIKSGIDSEHVFIERSGEGWFVCKNKIGERVFLSLVPYPTESRYREDVKEGESFSDKMNRWLNVGVSFNKEHLPQILVGHFFTVGGLVSDSEREIDLGGARAVAKEMIPPCDYVALGHLHKKQVMSRTHQIRYSGSILQYSFDESETEKSVTVFDLNQEGISNLREIALTEGKRLKRVYAKDLDEAECLLKQEPNCYLELNLRLDRPLEYSENKKLRLNFPDLVRLNLEMQKEEKQNQSSKKALNDHELFVEYYRSKFGKAPDKQLLSLYLGIMEEIDETR